MTEVLSSGEQTAKLALRRVANCPDEVRTILRHAQQRFGPKAQVDTFTVADLDALLKD